MSPNYCATLWIVVCLQSDRGVAYFGEAVNLEKAVKTRPNLGIQITGATESYQEPTRGERAAQLIYLPGERVRYHGIGEKVA